MVDKWFKNKKTGITWHITNDEHAERLAKDQDYEEVQAPAKEKVTQKK